MPDHVRTPFDASVRRLGPRLLLSFLVAGVFSVAGCSHLHHGKKHPDSIPSRPVRYPDSMCSGYFPTCWRRFPDGCPACPVDMPMILGAEPVPPGKSSTMESGEDQKALPYESPVEKARPGGATEDLPEMPHPSDIDIPESDDDVPGDGSGARKSQLRLPTARRGEPFLNQTVSATSIVVRTKSNNLPKARPNSAPATKLQASPATNTKAPHATNSKAPSKRRAKPWPQPRAG